MSTLAVIVCPEPESMFVMYAHFTVLTGEPIVWGSLSYFYCH